MPEEISKRIKDHFCLQVTIKKKFLRLAFKQLTTNNTYAKACLRGVVRLCGRESRDKKITGCWGGYLLLNLDGVRKEGGNWGFNYRSSLVCLRGKKNI